MSEKVKEFNRVIQIVYDVDVGGKGHKSEWIAKGHSTLSLIEKSAYDQLAEVNKVLVEALENIRWSWENDAGRQCDNIAHEAIAKAKEMSK